MRLTVYKVTDKFERGVSDPEWLPEAGRNGWIVLTKDKAIRRRPNEMMALMNSGVRAFVLAAGEITGADQAALRPDSSEDARTHRPTRATVLGESLQGRPLRCTPSARVALPSVRDSNEAGLKIRLYCSARSTAPRR